MKEKKVFKTSQQKNKTKTLNLAVQVIFQIMKQKCKPQQIL